MTTLYRFYDADSVLLYVGISDHPLARLDCHSTWKPWWPHARTATFEHCLTRDDALAREAEAIRTEHPAFNVIHNDTTRSDAYQLIAEARAKAAHAVLSPMDRLRRR